MIFSVPEHVIMKYIFKVVSQLLMLDMLLQRSWNIRFSVNSIIIGTNAQPLATISEQFMVIFFV